MHPISVMIKPASSGCNLRCSYCFYADEAAMRTIPNYGIMKPQVLENAIALFLGSAKGSCSFAFQGGEPTLAGLEFFQKVVELQKKYRRPGLTVTNALQTNGILLDNQWCEFLAQNHFLVGLSLDGVKDTHDRYRRGPDGKGSYAAVLRAAQRMEAHHVDFNILTVVTAQLAQNITKVYGFYKKNRWFYQQYIPCMDALEDARGGKDYSLTPSAYGDFLKKLFDLWYQDFRQGLVVSVRYFDNLLQMLQGYPPESCAMAGHCNVHYLVEADGSVFPCDFYAMDDYRIGNLNTDTVEQMDQQRRAIRFLETSVELTQRCKGCPWYSLCRGGCRRDYTQGEDAHNYYCESYRAFFEYAFPRLRQAAAVLQRMRSARPPLG
ncbi:MAG: anaerobic sulfatase maturase [Acutalibacter sp.]|jgi:uncharacterized protein